MTKKRLVKATCTIEFDGYQDGSVLKGTLTSGITELRTHLTIESPEPESTIRHLIWLAKRGCYAEQLVANPIPIKSTYELNGNPIATIDLTEEPGAL